MSAPEGISGELEVFGCNKTSFFILSLSRTAKLWCVKAGENHSPNEDLVRRYCFNLDPIFVGNGNAFPFPTRKRVSVSVSSLRYYINPNTLLWRTYCATNATLRGLAGRTAVRLLFLHFTLLEVGLLDLLTEAIPIIKSRNLLK